VLGEDSLNRKLLAAVIDAVQAPAAK